MGTMCKQNPRPKREIDITSVGYIIDSIKEIADNKKISLDQALKAYELIAYERRTNVMIDNGDFSDENMCGVGTAIKDVAEQLGDIAEAISEFHKA